MTAVLLDTSTVIYVFERQLPAAVAALASFDAALPLTISAVTLAELRAGMHALADQPKGAATAKRTVAIAEKFDRVDRLTLDVIDHWARISQITPRRVGHNDRWIIATAASVGCSLVTGDAELHAVAEEYGVASTTYIVT